VAGALGEQANPLDRMAAVAIGAWGRRDLEPATPIELLFICEANDVGPLDCRLARRIVALCGERYANGHLCDVETARELWGAPGPLVTPLKALVDYLRDNASVEQMIAMAELRVISGSAELRSLVDGMVRDLLTSDMAASALVAHGRMLVGGVEALAT